MAKNFFLQRSVTVIFFAAVIGGVGSPLFTEIKWLTWIFLLLLTPLFVIVPPIWLLKFGTGTKGIELSPRWRILSALGFLGIPVGPMIMIVLEMIILLGSTIIGLVITAIQKPGSFLQTAAPSKGLIFQYETQSKDFASKLTQTPRLESGTRFSGTKTLISISSLVLVPYWFARGVIEAVGRVDLGFKNNRNTRAGICNGNASAALSAFALIESLNASGNGSTTSADHCQHPCRDERPLHTTTSGLVGWGIVSAFREKKQFLRMGAAR
ncbi:MAG: hypothetical protein IPN58_21465 [Anaerolineales bacterium]|nr:hypothetical protein [Anaerolineales bacterium]